jgi:hypothetical protein
MALDIVGGTYLEICNEPIWNEFFGSGLRAAYALSPHSSDINFHTMIGYDDYERLMCISKSIGVQITAVKVPETTFFTYEHPLANPIFCEPVMDENMLIVEAKNVLQFGMVEDRTVVHAERVIYDPQSPMNPHSFWVNGSTTKELVWIANLQEMISFTGCADFQKIKTYLFEQEKIDAAVIKKGSDGAILIRKNQSDFHIPAYKTEQVWPIGTGDIFSSTFAYSYLIKNFSLEDSAYSASLATAYYAETSALPLPQYIDASRFNEFKNSETLRKKVYLAGPFFSMSQRWLIGEVRQQLLKFNLDVFSPYHDVGVGSPQDVVPLDIEAIKKSDIVVAILDGLDPGTLFEIGFARALNIPVVAFNENNSGESLTMLIGTGCKIEADFSTLIYKTFWEAHAK